MINKITIDTLLHGSWGYDQTNCELYQVIEKPSRCKVIIREIKSQVVKDSESFMSCTLKPVKNVFVGPEKKCTISAYGVILHRSCTLHPTTENETHYSSWYA